MNPNQKLKFWKLIDEVIKELNDSQMEQLKKDSMTEKLSKLKEKLEI